MVATVFRPGRTLQLPMWGKPRIDPSHPLAQGLIYCFLPGVSLTNLAQVPLDLGYDSGTAGQLSGTLEGPSWNSSAANSGIFQSATVRPVTNASLYYRGAFTADASNINAVICGFNYTSNPTGPYNTFQFARNQNGNGQDFVALVITTPSSADYPNTGGSLAIDTSHYGKIESLGGTYVGDGITGQSTIYTGGQQLDQQTDFTQLSTGLQYGSDPQFIIGTTAGDHARLTCSNANMVCCWNRTLSAAEMQWIDADPYGFLLWDEQEWPALISVAPAANPFIPGDFSAPKVIRARPIPAAEGQNLPLTIPQQLIGQIWLD